MIILHGWNIMTETKNIQFFYINIVEPQSIAPEGSCIETHETHRIIKNSYYV